MKRTHVVAAAVAGVHLLGVLLTALYVSGSTAGQAPLVWVYWMFIDLPWSLPLWQLMSGSFVLIHGVIGTAWWYLLVLLIGRLIAFAKAKTASLASIMKR
jgi:hypothetical protein